MNDQQLRELQAPLKDRYRQDAASAFATMTVRARLDRERLACDIDTGHGPVTAAGLHPLAGGDGSFVCSAEMLLESLAGCAGVTFCAVATAMKIPFTTGTLLVEGDIDFRGTLGVSRDVPVGFLAIRLTIEIDGPLDDTQAAKLAQLTERYCVVAQSLNAAASPQIQVRSAR